MAEAITMMRCERLTMTLSTAACARLWRSAQEREPAPWEGRFHCRACPIGCRNAGEAAQPAAAALEALRTLCPRCGRRADRLIRGELCVSCYNREREALRGRNAKGGRPRLCAVLGTERLAVAEPQGGAIRVERLERVTRREEAMIRVAKRAGGPIAIGVPPVLPPPGFQMEMPL